MEEILLKDHEVAKLLNCSNSKLRNDRSNRCGLPYIKIHGAIRYRRKDIEDYLEARTVRPESGK